MGAPPRRPAAPIVSLQHVGKTFANGTVALADLHLSIHEGEFLALLGPSGCGKSTALRMIAGLAEPSLGSIEWAQPVAHGEEGGHHDIGFVFQEPTLMPWATVFENVFLPLRLAGVGRKAAQGLIEEALTLVGLSGFAKNYPRELSGGMKMRVSIARALVTRPKVLLMDEPFAALDEITRFKLNDDLSRLKTEMNWTVVFVTHSIFESVYLADRIVVMAARPGRVVGEIAVDEALPRTAGFRLSPSYAEACRHVSALLEATLRPEDHR